MHIYNRLVAVQYALKYAIVHNPEWPDDKAHGGDCTNFVSQALHAGGWTMIWPGSIFSGPTWHSPRAPLTTRMAMNRSPSWAAASNFADFLARSGRARRCEVHELNYGDVVQLRDLGRVYHTMIVTAMEARWGRAPTPILTYHSFDTLAKPITEIGVNVLQPWKINDVFFDPPPNPTLPRAS